MAKSSGSVVVRIPVPSDDGYCGDSLCRCPPEKRRIIRGGGFMYISSQACKLIDDMDHTYGLIDNINVLENADPEFAQFIRSDRAHFIPVLICELAAKRRSLDLRASHSDAETWWNTGNVAIRQTPWMSKILDVGLEYDDTNLDTMELIQRFLYLHLSRLRTASIEHEGFLDGYFDDRWVDSFSRRISEHIERTIETEEFHELSVFDEEVSCFVDIIPMNLARSRRWYADKFGGYLKRFRYLTERSVEMGAASKTACHFIFGVWRGNIWLNISMVPTHVDSPVSLGIMAIELLSEDERQELCI